MLPKGSVVERFKWSIARGGCAPFCTRSKYLSVISKSTAPAKGIILKIKLIYVCVGGG